MKTCHDANRDVRKNVRMARKTSGFNEREKMKQLLYPCKN